MTDAQRREAIKKLMDEHTAVHAASKKAARKWLISTGIYTRAGELAPEFGGKIETGTKVA